MSLGKAECKHTGHPNLILDLISTNPGCVQDSVRCLLVYSRARASAPANTSDAVWNESSPGALNHHDSERICLYRELSGLQQLRVKGSYRSASTYCTKNANPISLKKQHRFSAEPFCSGTDWTSSGWGAARSASGRRKRLDFHNVSKNPKRATSWVAVGVCHKHRWLVDWNDHWYLSHWPDMTLYEELETFSKQSISWNPNNNSLMQVCLRKHAPSSFTIQDQKLSKQETSHSST